MDVSGVVTHDGLGELVKRIDLLRGIETDGAETMETSGRKSTPRRESTRVERLGIVVEAVDDLVNELWRDVG